MRSQLCIDYEESLCIPGVDLPLWGSWGVEGQCNNNCTGSCSKHCGKAWNRKQRGVWRRALFNAQRQIHRLIGMPICEQEICDEIHKIDCPIHLNNKPVLALGKRVYGELIEMEVTCGLLDEVTGPNPPNPCPPLPDGPICVDDYFCWVVIEPDDIPENFTIDDLYWCYCPRDCPYENLDLPQPCVYETVDEEANQIWVALWPKYQLINPLVDCTKITEDENFLTCVCMQTCVIDPDLAIEPVNRCKCCDSFCGCVGPCNHSNNGSAAIFTARLGDGDIGDVCIKPLCGCDHSRVKINYIVGLTCYGENTDLYEAIVKLALSKFRLDDDLCSCDKFAEALEYWLQEDPSQRQTFAQKLTFGPTRAGMDAWRIVNIYLKRPLLHQKNVSASGGFFTSRKIKPLN